MQRDIPCDYFLRISGFLKVPCASSPIKLYIFNCIVACGFK